MVLGNFFIVLVMSVTLGLTLPHQACGISNPVTTLEF